MNTLKQRLLTNWGLMRIFRLGMGVMLMVMGFQSKDWAMGLFSSIFIFQAVTDTGCCGSRGCSAPTTTEKREGVASANETIIEYEEIK